MSVSNLTYKDSGVDYGAMDPFKKKCQEAAMQTRDNIKRLGIKEISWSRGESAYLLRFPAGIVSHVEEGLGTKSLVADAVYPITGRSHYDGISQDTIAMIVNDMVTLQTFPVSLAMHLAVEDGSWFKDEKRVTDLINGWKHACNLARCTWGGGETPTLKDIVVKEATVLSGSGVGFSKKLHIPKAQEGDAIIMFSSSGIHANGLSQARKIATTSLVDGYQTMVTETENFGELLLKPTHIYVGVIEDLQKIGVDIHYAVNITGHGWRKLMRLNTPLTYRITTLGPQLPIFSFIQKHAGVDDREIYGNLNVGAGFAIYISNKDAEKVIDYVNKGSYGFTAWYAGHIEKGEKKVIIEPKNIIFRKDDLEVR